MAVSVTGTRVCGRCGAEKPETAFHVRKDLEAGFLSYCKDCVSKQRREYRESHAELVRNQKAAYYQHSKDKILEKNREWRMRNPQKVKECNRRAYQKRKGTMRNQKLQKAYGIDQIEYNELFIIQNGRCAVCGKHQSQLSKAMGVDHNHDTAEIRGLLCSCCNRALGMFSDDAAILKKAIAYLEKQS